MALTRRSARPEEDFVTATNATTATVDGPRTERLAGWHPVLLAAYAVLFLWSQNLGETSPPQVLAPLLIVVLAASLLTVGLGILFRDRRRGALVAAPLLVGGLGYGHAANLVDRFGIPGLVQAAWLAIVVVAIVAAIRLDAARVASLDRLLGRLALVLIGVALVLIIPHQVRAVTSAPATPAREPAATTTDAPRRDVYWLVFDRYGSDRAIELRYGVKNDLTSWLRDEGFTVLPDSHANYIRTVLSMATTLNMAPLAELVPDQGADSTDLGAVNATLQSPLVARQFQALGYRYHHIGSWWDPTRTDAGADVNHLPPGTSPLTGDFVDVLVGETVIPPIARRLGFPIDTEETRHFTYATFALDTLAALPDDPDPMFVVAHVLLPHGPYVFDRDGSYLGTEEARAAGVSSSERYERQLDFTNRRLREILGAWLARPEAERPIIILQADEGPWPAAYTAERKSTADWAERATPEDLEMKYGILNAWYLPGGEDLGLDPSMTAIETFPTLFGRYFGIHYPVPDARSYGSRDWYHPYDLLDITDRLPAP